MAWTDAVDLYCERLGPGLWAEPLNALSNLGFVLMGAGLFRYARRAQLPPSLSALAVLLVLIGLGSASFHTLAVKWAELLDMLFIALFIYFYTACFVRHRLAAPWWLALLAIPAYHLFGMAVTSPFEPGNFNGSVGYFPALMAMLLLGVLAGWLQGWRTSLPFFAAFAVFGLSLTLRTQDLANCAVLPMGTHWLWHLLNAVTLGLAWWGLRISPRLKRR